jgi:hypothetical protein
LRRILKDIGEKQEKVVHLHCDNKSAKTMAKKIQFIIAGPNKLQSSIISLDEQLKKAKWS